jgi:formyltetrahydrofolate-dependent phosphoribosylglycinamide formyltransferase
LIRIAVLVSGNGSNLQSLIDGCRSGYIPGEIKLVISSKSGAYALQRAIREDISTRSIERFNFINDEEYSAAILHEVKAKNIDLICCAGFLSKLGNNIISEYKNKIINIHPALLPAFGGKSMYGIKVHEEVLKSGAEYSGCTVHFVDEEYDHGPTIDQRRVEVLPGDTPQMLQARILKEEHELYPEVVRKIALGEVGDLKNTQE